MSGTIVKSGFSMYSPLSDVPTVHDVQVLLHPSSAPLRHGGSCSAPKMTVPPDFGFVADVPADPTVAKSAADRATSASTAKPTRCIRFLPFECPPIVRTGGLTLPQTERDAQS